jgi:glycosyltransferase involved in cell wall biosynthesis
MKISIIIPYYNGEEFIAKAIRSVKNQSYTNFEVLLVNNGSTDHSEAIAKCEVGEDKRFVFLKEPKLGISNALNTGVLNSTGEYISFLDCDDIYMKNRLKITVKYIKNGFDLIACRGLKIDKSGNVFGETPQFFQSSEIIKTVLMRHNIVNSLSYITINKNAFINAFPSPRDYTWILDYYLMLFASKENMKIKLIDEPLVKRLYHDKNHSSDYAKIMKQVVPLLINTYESNESIKKSLTKERLINVLTKKYIIGAQYMRRHGKIEEIITYLKNFVESGYIRDDIYFYFLATAYYSIEKSKFYDFVKNNKTNHHFGDFIRGFYHFELKEFGQAEFYFKKLLTDKGEMLPDIMNLCALAQYFMNKEKGISGLKNIIANFPDYQDAYYNLDYIYLNNEEELKKNIFLMPSTIEVLLGFPKRKIELC